MKMSICGAMVCWLHVAWLAKVHPPLQAQGAGVAAAQARRAQPSPIEVAPVLEARLPI
jgi:hypothetical protein